MWNGIALVFCLWWFVVELNTGWPEESAKVQWNGQHVQLDLFLYRWMSSWIWRCLSHSKDSYHSYINHLPALCPDENVWWRRSLHSTTMVASKQSWTFWQLHDVFITSVLDTLLFWLNVLACKQHTPFNHILCKLTWNLQSEFLKNVCIQPQLLKAYFTSGDNGKVFRQCISFLMAVCFPIL